MSLELRTAKPPGLAGQRLHVELRIGDEIGEAGLGRVRAARFGSARTEALETPGIQRIEHDRGTVGAVDQAA